MNSGTNYNPLLVQLVLIFPFLTIYFKSHLTLVPSLQVFMTYLIPGRSELLRTVVLGVRICTYNWSRASQETPMWITQVLHIVPLSLH
jgi:hypothetical protein